MEITRRGFARPLILFPRPHAPILKDLTPQRVNNFPNKLDPGFRLSHNPLHIFAHTVVLIAIRLVHWDAPPHVLKIPSLTLEQGFPEP